MARGRRTGWLWTVAIAFAFLGYVQFSTDDYLRNLVMWIALNSVIAVALRFMLLVGETNIATGAFYGIGAYVAAVFTVKSSIPFPLALVAGGVVTMAIGLLFGFITLRTTGPYFMLISFAFTEVVRLIYTRFDWLGGNSGLVGIYPPDVLDPWMPAVVGLICGSMVLMMYLLERSNLGLVFKAVENNGPIVETTGINVVHVKILCLVISGFVLGIAGATHAFVFNVISPGDFSYLVPVFALAYIKIGGDDHVVGCILGAILLTVINQYLLGSGEAQHIIFGGAIIVSMVLLPKGLWGAIMWLLRLRRNPA